MATIEQRQAPLPQGPGYTLKRTVLGRPLPTAHLVHERPGKPTALAVFASDNLSSVAYATEEILKVAVPVAGAAAFGLLTDYVLTVSVSVAAGVAAIVSAAPSLFAYRVELSVFSIWFIAWGNLRGVRESGRMFAVPTYFFIITM